MEVPGRPLVRGIATGHLEKMPGPLAGRLTSSDEPSAPILFARSLPRPGSGANGAPTLVRGLILEEVPATAPPDVTVPTVAGVDGDLLETGDRVRVDGDRGVVELADLPLSHVVTCFIERSDGRILVLRRSRSVSTFQGKWAAVSGYIESVTPLEQAYTEIREETGISRDQLTLITSGPVVWARGEGHGFAVHPFHFRVVDPKVQIEREHTESKWIPPSEIAGLDSVPRLLEAWERVVVDSRHRTSEHATPRKR